MSKLDIPFEKDRKGHYRFFEILPGTLSWTLLILPVVLAFINATVAVTFILAYLLIFFVRAIAYLTRAIMGYQTMKKHMKLDWNGLAADIDAGKVLDTPVERPVWHVNNIARLDVRKEQFKPKELWHAIILATVNESREVLEPTIQSILASKYDMKKVIFVIAYEGRAGKQTEDRVNELLKLYGKNFKHAMAVNHPAGIPGELIGKGGNITYAGRELAKYIESVKIDPAKVLVTTLDADNKPDPNYLPALSYLYCVVPNPLHASYQPLAMFTNNIWDAPTLMRIIAIGNNHYYLVGSQRPHRSRNFSAHAQPLKPLIDMDFWSVRTIVEDGHQFWRSYFHFDGDYRVYPLAIPIYQDAVLAEGYWRTTKAQFYQLRRWTYGASDIAYIADQGFWKGSKAPKLDVVGKFLVTLEGHVTWATGIILTYVAAFIPAFLHPTNIAANELPLIVSRVQRIGLVGAIALVYVALLTVPPRPARYKRHRSILMVAQWVLLPVTSFAFGSLAAFNSQTRLMFKRYLSKFDVTEKARVSASGKKTSTIADPDA